MNASLTVGASSDSIRRRRLKYWSAPVFFKILALAKVSVGSREDSRGGMHFTIR